MVEVSVLMPEHEGRGLLCSRPLVRFLGGLGGRPSCRRSALVRPAVGITSFLHGVQVACVQVALGTVLVVVEQTVVVGVRVMVCGVRAGHPRAQGMRLTLVDDVVVVVSVRGQRAGRGTGGTHSRSCTSSGWCST